jgi:hypothetical protein
MHSQDPKKQSGRAFPPMSAKKIFGAHVASFH